MDLQYLRENTVSACRNNSFPCTGTGETFRGQGRTGLVEGGPCTIAVIRRGEGIHELRASPSGSGQPDGFFYPWVPTGVGWVPVPADAKNGTLVLTGALNGCGIEITRDGDTLNFYHDSDCRYLTDAMRQGETVVRLTGLDYDRLDWGKSMFERRLGDAMARGMRGAFTYGYCIIGVKQDNRWGLYVTGVSDVGTPERLSLPWGTVPCLATFPA